MIFRPTIDSESKYSKSIIIPAKNEEGNLEELVDRIPKFQNTEIIFSYGNSKDKTWQVMESIKTKNQDFDIKVISQTKSGKANAVWEALDIVENEVVAILDADISVEPETLVDFFKIIDSNRADFVNGTRLIYDMEKNSMRFLNKIGNRFFQFFVSRVIKEQLTDSLCGTKVFKKSYIKDLNLWQEKLWIEDPFGDFDMIFSAAYTGQKIVELPIYYKERRYGETQISRFKDGFKLLVYLGESFIRFNTSRNV
jgi:glycosyltransferase involved in cell wall biosynthesis